MKPELLQPAEDVFLEDLCPDAAEPRFTLVAKGSRLSGLKQCLHCGCASPAPPMEYGKHHEHCRFFKPSEPRP